ncbi:hypothetical protein [Streptomyces chattanoogensis]|uniref:Uncharacterized protein n=1 Tax=Streptomyces chattanoogensis TaxID=66876 RepID=A0A0N0H1R1_9ACTN|nr:hypothetical protein [Streptomyces chattanoogensis]KPC64709.1 hypothetical protein ADL29_11090 [Streptomyces chattanoogensis]
MHQLTEWQLDEMTVTTELIVTCAVMPGWDSNQAITAAFSWGSVARRGRGTTPRRRLVVRARPRACRLTLRGVPPTV